MKKFINKLVSFITSLFGKNKKKKQHEETTSKSNNNTTIQKNITLHYTFFNSEATISDFSIPTNKNQQYTVTIPNTVTYDNIEYPIVRIKSYLFKDCLNIDNVIYQNNYITNIEASTFIGCSNLKTITLPSKLKTIHSSAFRNCSSLTNINLPDTLSEIDDAVFMYCNKIKHITIPQNVTTIKDSTFSCCENLVSVKFNGNISYIEDRAFIYCTSLKEITFSGNAPIVNKNTFYGIPPTCIIRYKKGSKGWGAIWNGFETVEV